MKLNWLTKQFMHFLPWTVLKYTARQQKIDSHKIDYAEELFRDCKKVYIEPLHGSGRGFIIFLDNKLSLWFYQDGDHFVYDGFEIGHYDNRDVTVFGELNRK